MRVTWLVNSMGYNNRLLYWEHLLRRFVEEFPETTIWTSETECSIEKTNKRVERTIPRWSFRIGDRQIAIPSPLAVLKVARHKPNLIVISEFGWLSLYAVVYKFIRRRTKLLLLVENHPSYLKNYSVNRQDVFFSRARQLIASSADLVLTNNDRAARYLSDDLGIASGKVMIGCYLTSSVSPPLVARTACPNRLHLLFVGQLIPRKGLVELLKAVAKLPATLRTNLALDVVGEGPARREIEARCKSLQLSNIVTFHGAQPYEQMGTFFSRADVFVFPTLGDYRALVGFEAISAGLPIIGSIFDGASEEIVEEGVNGFLVDPRDEDTLSERISRFLNNPELVMTFSKASLHRSKAFSPDIAATSLIYACHCCMSS